MGKFVKPTKCANVTNADLTTSRNGLNNPHLMYIIMTIWGGGGGEEEEEEEDEEKNNPEDFPTSSSPVSGL